MSGPKKPADNRKKLQVYVPNPILDHFLTALFAVLIGLVVKVLYDEPQRPGDFTTPLGTFGVFLVLCYGLITVTKYASRWVASKINALLLSLGLVSKAPIIGRTQIRKWQDQSWQLVIHVSMTAFECYILTVDTPGLWSDMSLAWTPDPRQPSFMPSLLLTRFYLFQLAIWTVTCGIHRFSMERIKDYFMMYTHHVLTIGLIVGSYYMKFVRIGLLVLLVHDVSDIGVDLLKIFNYMKLRERQGLYGIEIMFGVNLTWWTYWRLYIYPFFVIHASWVMSLRVGSPDMPYEDLLPTAIKSLFSYRVIQWDGMPMWGISNILLFALLVLHIIWTALFLRILKRVLLETPQKAAQAEYEGESDAEDGDEEEPWPTSNQTKRAATKKSAAAKKSN